MGGEIIDPSHPTIDNLGVVMDAPCTHYGFLLTCSWDHSFFQPGASVEQCCIRGEIQVRLFVQWLSLARLLTLSLSLSLSLTHIYTHLHAYYIYTVHASTRIHMYTSHTHHMSINKDIITYISTFILNISSGSAVDTSTFSSLRSLCTISTVISNKNQRLHNNYVYDRK